MHGRSRRGICASAAIVVGTVCGLLATARPAYAIETSRASTSAASRADALRSIPLRKLDPRYRQSVQQVLNDTSLYRRLPTMMVECHPPMFTFMAKNPDLLVQIWRQLGISNVNLVRTGTNAYRLTDNVGTTGKLVIVEQTCDDLAQNRIVMYAEGAYEGKPFKRPMTAQCVMLLRSGSVKETNGRPYVAARLDTFVRIDRTSLELFAKALHPLVGKNADRNFSDTITFIGNLSQAAETRPVTIERLALSLPHTSSGQRSELVQLAYQCSKQKSASAVSTGPRLARTAD